MVDLSLPHLFIRTKKNVLSAFAAGEGEKAAKCTRVSIRDYIKMMR